MERSGLVAASLGHAAQAFGPTDGVFDVDAAASMSRIVGSLGVSQGWGVFCFGAACDAAGCRVAGRSR